MKLFGYLEKPDTQLEENRPSLSTQIKTYIEQTRLKIKKKDKAFRVKAIIASIFYLYITGLLASIFRYFGEIPKVGYNAAPPVELWPWSIIIALFNFKYSLLAILITLLIAVAILIWWIRNHIGLGAYALEERGGLKFKKQEMDATLGSAREMTAEEIVKTFTVTPANEFFGRNNPGRIIFGRDKETNDYITEKNIPHGERPNRNTITLGSAGSFKTGSFIIPLILQLSRAGENLIINDPATEIGKATIHILESRGYEVKILNISNPEVSDGWNFIGACGENSILSKTFAHMIIDGSAGKGKPGDSFWPEGMYVLLSALILYVNTTSTNTIEHIRHMLNDIDLNKYPDYFEGLSENHPARMEFNTYMTSPVQRNVLNGAAQRLAMFNSSAISRICSSEGIDIINDFATPGKKTAVFIVASDVESTFSFIPSLFLTASAVQLSDYAKNCTDELTLPQHVHFIMDEFSNTARVEDIGRYFSATRKYGLVFHLIIQSLPQFYQRYDENEVLEIVGNCQYTLGFGAGEPMTAEFFEKYCGPTTVRTGMTASNSVVLKTTDQFREGEQQRSLFFANEILTMDPTQYLLLINGKHPLTLKKAYWKNLEDSKYAKDFQMKDYIPRNCEYIPMIDTNTDENKGNDLNDSENEFKGIKYGLSPATPISKTQAFTELSGNSYRDKTNTDRVPGNRNTKGRKKKENKPLSYDETPFLFQKNYYLERAPINADSVYSQEKGGNKQISFINNYNEKGEPRPAILLRFDIDGTECKVEGIVPDNRYAVVKSKIELHEIESACKISKENCVHVGWKLKYKRNEKEFETKRLKTDKPNLYVNENGEVVKSYSFVLPKTDCVISPVFEAAKGSSKNKEEPSPKPTFVSTEDTVIRM